VALSPDRLLTPEFWSDLVKENPPTELVLWLGPQDLTSFPQRMPPVYLSATLNRNLPQGASNVFVISPVALPPGEAVEAAHARGWFRAEHVGLEDPRISLDCWFALSLVDYSLESMPFRISGDYLLETVERETESMPNPGVYARLSLGPGQRIASKSFRMYRLRGDKIAPVSDWILP
jgi:hypothetical protein